MSETESLSATVARVMAAEVRRKEALRWLLQIEQKGGTAVFARGTYEGMVSVAVQSMADDAPVLAAALKEAMEQIKWGLKFYDLDSDGAGIALGKLRALLARYEGDRCFLCGEPLHEGECRE